ncbi:GerMN domain-containing protein [Paratissierella segnis]|jgi:hypothetical protein|uniref:GerMN domain-containing protein n=1 Tax=Paratissierella segnis TaxID=2763679 RepID=A0A926ESZ8_9FIRM|nr:GerMN domain-containing protein [Paratissierella segnis]MBC8589218.1 GerMN domain-containing protein [Paratissierella segnis]
MKKHLYIIALLTLILVIGGCQTSTGAKKNNTLNTSDQAIALDEGVKATDYYPFYENKIYEYEGIGNEYAEQKVFVEFIDDNKAQLKIMNPGTNIIKIVEYKDGALSEVYSEGEFYHIENMLNVKADKENIILKEPIAVGNSWSTEDGDTKEITNLDKPIDTPYGQFKALETVTKYKDGGIEKEYYVKNIGLVARIFGSEGDEIETLLNSIEAKPLEHVSQFFYPLYSDVGSVYLEDKILFYTNQSIEKLFEEKLKNVPSNELIAPLAKDIKINSIHFDRTNKWTVKVDFSKELLMNTKEGTALESEVLKSIVNTFGKFYDSERVYISVNGVPYESGHFAMESEEGFLVDTEGIEEFVIK